MLNIARLCSPAPYSQTISFPLLARIAKEGNGSALPARRMQSALSITSFPLHEESLQNILSKKAPKKNEQLAAIVALGYIGKSSKSVGILSNVLIYEPSDEQLLIAAAWALKEIGTKEALHFLDVIKRGGSFLPEAAAARLVCNESEKAKEIIEEIIIGKNS
ncbi:hypothetical protein A3J90_03230 [candidate division WOR-1 bacterium RIFOXYC2_FULL_37_10]|uniref:HEAT repeat domain-containing protein n=1 Tax=candidate division WOR-1 bacterium RIFOXYB2_FULL_37_13 TaxID=1802579 RepID=A0A1F4SDR1_UNCSA|nr:MAG: hypothetical protein A2246_05065 [candidate division WOR-1 bacterium RIFOXYA2_FULL_37_7]OGC18549.1 MAG: hypothetical protein A2310_01930 [candidate division WOR-1 bacterium RIFOXYB2_FULL_37_13]OGC36868.1 MAG: hypothetical protein A3J90_03230 [candidate division WOR-1 bacterium RIFOXYC2_FULL_37_10]